MQDIFEDTDPYRTQPKFKFTTNSLFLQGKTSTQEPGKTNCDSLQN